MHYHIIQKMQLCHRCASLHQPCTCAFHISSQLILGNPSFCNPTFQNYSVLCIIEHLKVLWQYWETKYSKLICSLKAGDLNLSRQRPTFTLSYIDEFPDHQFWKFHDTSIQFPDNAVTYHTKVHKLLNNFHKQIGWFVTFISRDRDQC